MVEITTRYALQGYINTADEGEIELLVDFPGSKDEYDSDEEMCEPTNEKHSQQQTKPVPNDNSISIIKYQSPPHALTTRETQPEAGPDPVRKDLSKTTDENSRPGADSYIAELLRKQMEQSTSINRNEEYESDDENFNISDVTYGGRDQTAPSGMGGGPAPDRPLVGGFAAAAYEAARAHYLSNHGGLRSSQRLKGYTPPSI